MGTAGSTRHRQGHSPCAPIQHLFIAPDSSPVRRDHGCCRGNPNQPGRLQQGPVLVQAGAALAPQSMETDGDPRMGAEGPHGAGSVQRHHAGLSPPAVQRGWQRWQRGQEWQDTGATVPQSHRPPRRASPPSPSQPALARGPGGARAKPPPCSPCRGRVTEPVNY